MTVHVTPAKPALTVIARLDRAIQRAPGATFLDAPVKPGHDGDSARRPHR